MSKKTRQHRSVQKKAELLRAHLDQKRPVSEICEESELQPSVFYTWQRQLVATAEVALAARAGARRPRASAELDGSPLRGRQRQDGTGLHVKSAPAGGVTGSSSCSAWPRCRLVPLEAR
jgi:transposase-like protein